MGIQRKMPMELSPANTASVNAKPTFWNYAPNTNCLVIYLPSKQGIHHLQLGLSFYAWKMPKEILLWGKVAIHPQ